MKNILLLAAILFILFYRESKTSESTSPGDVKNVEYGIREIPSVISYTGSPVAMVTWEDNSGKNLLFVTVTEEISKGDTRSKELFGYHIITDGSGNRQLWKIYDFVKDCEVDLTLAYIDGSLSITDLDNNGTGESSLMYRMSCKGDVSSDGLKLIMHEGEKKYALRGSMDLVMNGKDFQKGSMKVDPSFNSAPDEFLEFAKEQWDKYKTEKPGE
ncbi:MAG: hypothetical protein ABI462_05000 [Ignavibacteria bacterium]